MTIVQFIRTNAKFQTAGEDFLFHLVKSIVRVVKYDFIRVNNRSQIFLLKVI